MSREPEHSQPDARSLLSELRELLQGKLPAAPAPSEEEKAAALREYQRLVHQIDEVLREQEAERRSGIPSSDRER